MKILLSSIALLATVAIASDKYHTKKHAEIMENIEGVEFDATSPMFYVQGVRGLYLGFEDGMHEGNPKGQVCLVEDTQESLFHIVSVLMKRDFEEVTKLIPDVMEVFTDVKTCLRNKDSIVSYCASTPGQCSVDKLVKNGQTQMFKLMGTVTDIKGIIADFPPGTSTEFFDIANKVGNEIGSVLRIVTGYGKTEEVKSKRTSFNKQQQLKGKF